LRKGAWGLFQELGHNFQNEMWTWVGTHDVTANIYTLHAMDVICNIKPWLHSWIREQFDKSQNYLKVCTCNIHIVFTFLFMLLEGV
jgi:hypothetical protein